MGSFPHWLASIYRGVRASTQPRTLQQPTRSTQTRLLRRWRSLWEAHTLKAMPLSCYVGPWAGDQVWRHAVRYYSQPAQQPESTSLTQSFILNCIPSIVGLRSFLRLQTNARLDRRTCACEIPVRRSHSVAPLTWRPCLIQSPANVTSNVRGNYVER